jgi:hypothetical protein
MRDFVVDDISHIPQNFKQKRGRGKKRIHAYADVIDDEDAELEDEEADRSMTKDISRKRWRDVSNVMEDRREGYSALDVGSKEMRMDTFREIEHHVEEMQKIISEREKKFTREEVLTVDTVTAGMRLNREDIPHMQSEIRQILELIPALRRDIQRMPPEEGVPRADHTRYLAKLDGIARDIQFTLEFIDIERIVYSRLVELIWDVKKLLTRYEQVQ